MFSLSDTIICVNNSPLDSDLLACPLVLGQSYEVMGLKKCRCGVVYVDIGLSLSIDNYHVKCACGKRYIDGTWWFSAARFRLPAVKWESVKAAQACPN
jgi:hypothetical protein